MIIAAEAHAIAPPGIGCHCPAAALPFREIWCVDFEFRSDKGEKPWPVCMVARELNSGREVRLWRDELLSRSKAPFDTGPESLFVAYFASAELGCFLELGWPLPANVLDLYVEHRVETNGIPSPYGDGIVGALTSRGLAHIDSGEKELMRRLVCDQYHWSHVEQRAIFEYCASDVEGLAALLPKMTPAIDLPRALIRGRYMKAVARMERSGVPIDVDLYQRLVGNWDGIKVRLVEGIDAEFGVYDGVHFKSDRFRNLLSRLAIPWPTLKSGALALDDDTFRAQCRRWPELQPLHELRASLSGMRLTGLEVGSDGRNRCLLSPFGSVTGRNQPSNTKFVFGPARWIRGLIRPPEEYGIAYIDFSSQEIGIAAALSKDEQMIEGYLSGDPYLAFAKSARLAPADATKASHKAIRDRCKSIVLGINYGMGPDALAAAAGITPVEARELLALHRRTYRPFWNWMEGSVSRAFETNEMRTVLGWRRRLGREPNPRSLMNFPMQANGAEMMRIAAIAATEAGIEVCAPVHDAFLISAPCDRLNDEVATMQELMSAAGQVVTNGISIRTDAEIIRSPDRYMDSRGAVMWDRVMNLIDQQVPAPAV